MSVKKPVWVRFEQGLLGRPDSGNLVTAHGFVSNGPANTPGRPAYMSFDGPQLAQLLGAVPAMQFTDSPEVLKALNVVRNFLKGEDL